MKNIHAFLFKNQVSLLLFTIILLSAVLILFILKHRTVSRRLMKSRNLKENNLKSLRQMLDTIPDPIFCKDARGIYTECNIEFENALGLKREEIIGRTVYEVNQEYEQAEIYHKADIDLMKSGGKQIYESKFKNSKGEICDVVFRKAAIIADNGEALGLVGAIINISELKKKQNQIDRMFKIKEAFIQISQSMMDFNDIDDFFNLILEKAVSIIDKADHCSILKLNQSGNLEFAAHKNYDYKKIKKFSLPLEQSFIWLATKGDLKDVVIIDDVFKLNGPIVNVVENTESWKLKSVISAPIIVEGALYGLFSIDSNKEGAFSQDDAEIMQYIKSQVEMVISKHKLYKEKMYLMRYDKLTDLFNRGYFEELYEDLCSGTDKNKISFSLVIFDINDLKYINDNYGHTIGDEYLRAFARELKKTANDGDVIARYGGDEFVGIFFNTDAESLTTRLEEVLKRLSLNPVNRELNITCSFSYGIADFPEESKEYNHLITIADMRMYNYKREYKLKRKYDGIK